MVIRRRVDGTGITAKRTIVFDEDKDRADAEVARILAASEFEGLLAQIAAECFSVMQKADLPTKFGSYIFNRSGEWRSPEPPFHGMKATEEIWPIAEAQGYDRDSEVGFASRMLGDLMWLRTAQAEGDHDRVALLAYYLGIKRAEVRIKSEHESAWDSGRRAREGASKGGKGRAASDKISDRRRPLIACYQQKREECWEHMSSVRYACEHAYRSSDQERYSLKQARRILDQFK